MKVPAKIIKSHLKSVEEEQGYQTTFKQKEWLKLYLQTKNATEAAAQVYDVKDRMSAGQIGYENLKKLDMSELMDAMGMTDDYLADKVKEGMEKPVRIVTVKGEAKVVPDYQARHKYVDTALKLKKKLSDRVELTGKDGSPLQIELVAGIGFLNPVKDYEPNPDIIVQDDNDYLPEQIQTIAPPTGSNLAK